MKLFENLGLSNQLLTAIKHLGFNKPTQIQESSIPYIIEGKDVIGESATGSGKTLAFGCGIIEQVVPGKGLQSLILTPTRELAEQVKDSLKTFSYQKRLNITAIYGGVAINPQIYDLSKSEVVVATPGRILDHLHRRTVDPSRIKLLVLDEADRMLDMGFIEDIEKIIEACPKKRQTLFFSATISSRIKDMADNYMIQPKEILAEKMVDPSKLKQVYYDVNKNMKLSLLVHLLQHEDSGLAMVFCNTRRTTDFVVKNLRANKIDAIAIHGGLTQNKRTNTIKQFNNAKIGVLVCTDVAARGLHIDNVSHIYNYEIPNDSNDYVHRIGRTARAGEEGKVINLLCEYDYGNFSRILSEYRDFSIENVEKPHLERIMAIKVDEQRKGNSRDGLRRDYSRMSSGRGQFPQKNRWRHN
ncbi:MAG: DEAD/DEAH box helicase [Nanoarchaeota archaeon]|nr:DEAD/DEAH box helicase [Nanoarchaeota archaeon]MBU1632569.1 DEAD/DEAH box helicase [Nanoarchaeota archaeon]MBU1875780.1 DEAD/DEAH box helicase [Nanoarchaeota archaeon]